MPRFQENLTKYKEYIEHYISKKINLWLSIKWIGIYEIFLGKNKNKIIRNLLWLIFFVLISALISSKITKKTFVVAIVIVIIIRVLSIIPEQVKETYREMIRKSKKQSQRIIYDFGETMEKRSKEKIQNQVSNNWGNFTYKDLSIHFQETIINDLFHNLECEGLFRKYIFNQIKILPIGYRFLLFLRVFF